MTNPAHRERMISVETFDFERLAYRKLMDLAGPARYLPYRGRSGVYSCLGFHYRFSKAEAKQLLKSLRNRGLIRLGNRGIRLVGRNLTNAWTISNTSSGSEPFAEAPRRNSP